MRVGLQCCGWCGYCRRRWGRTWRECYRGCRVGRSRSRGCRPGGSRTRRSLRATRVGLRSRGWCGCGWTAQPRVAVRATGQGGGRTAWARGMTARLCFECGRTTWTRGLTTSRGQRWKAWWNMGHWQRSGHGCRTRRVIL
jgi:hypothetical protein